MNLPVSKFHIDEEVIFFSVNKMGCPEELEGAVVTIVGVQSMHNGSTYTIESKESGFWGAHEEHLRKLTKLEKALK